MISDGRKAIEIIEKNKKDIDIILLDLKLPNFNGIEILNYIERNEIIKFRQSIIVISGEPDLIIQVQKHPYLYTYIDKINGLDKINIELKKLIAMKEKEKSSLEYLIYSELDKLNFKFTYVGTRYLMESINLLYNFKNMDDIKIEKSIYSKLSKKHNKSVNTIKTNIINATDFMCYDCKPEILNKYFGICELEKPTPKTVMITIVKNIRKRTNKYEI